MRRTQMTTWMPRSARGAIGGLLALGLLALGPVPSQAGDDTAAPITLPTVTHAGKAPKDALRVQVTKDGVITLGDDATPLGAATLRRALAEKAAREFVAAEAPGMHYASVNPGFVLGPALDKDIGSSANTIVMIMQGKYPGMPRLHFSCVDVRDVAEAHLKAMQTGQPSGGRYLAVGGSLWFVEIARAIRQALGDEAKKVPVRELPDFLVKLIGLFDGNARSIVSDLGKVRDVDNSRTRAALDMTFRPPEEAAVATARSLVELGLVR